MSYTKTELEMMQMIEEVKQEQQQELQSLKQLKETIDNKIWCLETGKGTWCDEHDRFKTMRGTDTCAPCIERAKKAGDQ